MSRDQASAAIQAYNSLTAVLKCLSTMPPNMSSVLARPGNRDTKATP